VTEVGGLLSHAAVIGREYGIPAILNLNQATKLIHEGDLIKINGKTGEVEILEKSS
jgi:pyruvate,water dikinase